MAGAVIGCRGDEQVREPGDRSAPIGARAVTPLRGQGLAIPAADVDRRQEIKVITGGVDDDVEVDLAAVGGDKAPVIHLRRFTGLDVHVLAGQRGVVAAGVADDALTVRREIRSHLARQVGSCPEGAVDVLQAHLQQDVVGRRDRQVAVRPVWVTQDDRVAVVGGAPVRLEPVPHRVVRQHSSQIAAVLGDLVG